MDNKKRVVFISVLTILLVITGLYATYAINVFEEETTPTEYDMAFNFELSGNVTRQMTIPAGKTKVFDFDITNPYSDTIQYGVAYTLVNPTTLPNGVTIAESSLSKDSAVGMVDANKTVSVSIIVVNESTNSITLSFSVVNGYKNGGDLILKNGEVLIEGEYDVIPPSPSMQTLTNLGLKSLLKEGTPNFGSIATTDEGIYSAEDDLGTSYYFRGASEYNYVKFADSYWRIIRINGDGTIRMIYDGTTAHANGESSTDRHLIKKVYNSNSNDNSFIGYMNGTTNGTNFPNGGTNSISYAEAHANKTDSTIKDYIDNTWYQTLTSNEKSKIADAIYCNDRSIKSGSGFGQERTDYAIYWRLEDNEPTLKCVQPNDRLALKTSELLTSDGLGVNKVLKYPVGLINTDETTMAGGVVWEQNKSYYLYTGNDFWTMSPYNYVSNVQTMIIGYYGTTTFSIVDYDWFGIRPVLSLKADALKYDASTSNGTKEHPFVLAS